MKDLVILAQEQGFEPKTFSTKWTFEVLLGIKKDFFVNEQCISTLLAEIQMWVRGKDVDVFIDSVGGKDGYFYVLQDVKTGEQIENNLTYSTFEESLTRGIKKSLKYL